jgi:phage terminase large subunit
VLPVNCDQNPWFPPDLREAMEYDRQRDPEKYAHIWLGQYRRNSEARVFKNWIVAAYDTPSNAMFRFGADFGYSIDPTTLLRMFIGRWEGGVAIPDPAGRNLFIDYEAWEIGCEIDKTPALFDTVPESRAWTMTADSSRPETISYLRRNGFPKIAAAVKGARSVEEGVSFLQSYDIVIHPRCERAIAEFTMYSYKVDPLTGEVMPVLEDKDNHLIDSARYGCEALRRAVLAKPVFRPAPIPSAITGFRHRG